VLLVEDVGTTGATAIACGQQLIKAGHVTISVLSLGFTKT
jgi:predicted amidophosphoribosyltransferase